MDNRWNEKVYKMWSPVYDKFFNSGKFLKARKKIFRGERLKKGQHVLFVGVGTGADLELINHRELNIIAIDYSTEMLEKAKVKFKDTSIQFLKMDAQQLNFKDNQFDVVVGSLILSVVPDADRSFKEMIRVLKPNGSIIIFDKFLPKGEKLSPVKRVIRPLIKLLGTDIGVSFDRLYDNNKGNVAILEDKPIMFHGMYRLIVLTNQHS